MSIFHRCRNITICWSKVCVISPFYLDQFHLKPSRRDSPGTWGMTAGIENLKSLGYQTVFYGRLFWVNTSVWQTDRQTDRRTHRLSLRRAVGISWRCLMLIKTEWLGYRMVKKLWRYVKPFASDTGTLQTDGRTDLLYQYRTNSMLTRDKNLNENELKNKPMSKQHSSYNLCLGVVINGQNTVHPTVQLKWGLYLYVQCNHRRTMSAFKLNRQSPGGSSIGEVTIN